MRYFGGKVRIAKQISDYLNQYVTQYTQYAEPFCGSCNVATKINIASKHLNDKNKYVIAMFKALQTGWLPPDFVSEEDYQFVKNNIDLDMALTGFIGHGCSFAGKFFGGYAHDNCERNYALEGKNSLFKKMPLLKTAVFTNRDFQDLNYNNFLIYADPPYKNTTPYNKKVTGIFPYDDFLIWVKKQSRCNLIFISEYKHNVPEDATIVLEIPSKTDIRGSANKQISTTEVLWTYNRKELLKV